MRAVRARRAKLASVEREIREAGGEAGSLSLDLRAPDAPSQLVDFAIARYGRIDIVINNAGATRRGEFLELSDEDFVDGFALKYFGSRSAAQSGMAVASRCRRLGREHRRRRRQDPWRDVCGRRFGERRSPVADQVACRGRASTPVFRSTPSIPAPSERNGWRSVSPHSPQAVTSRSRRPNAYSSNRAGHPNRRARRHRESDRLRGEPARPVPARSSRSIRTAAQPKQSSVRLQADVGGPAKAGTTYDWN